MSPLTIAIGLFLGALAVAYQLAMWARDEARRSASLRRRLSAERAESAEMIAQARCVDCGRLPGDNAGPALPRKGTPDAEVLRHHHEVNGGWWLAWWPELVSPVLALCDGTETDLRPGGTWLPLGHDGMPCAWPEGGAP